MSDMKNRILCITRNGIPYIKEVRPIAGSVAATILMQQLDYWFERYPDSFYKFLSPCEHPLYKKGQSWTEELNFSKSEFRSAFACIGVQYKSKSQYQAAADPFEGKFYCSYHDRPKGTVRYFRNHKLVDAALDKIIDGSNTTDLRKSATPIPRNPQGRFTDDGDRDLQDDEDMDFQESGDVDFDLYTETTNRDHIQRLHTENTSELISFVHSDENPIAQSLQNSHSWGHDRSLPSGRDAIDTQNQDDRISLGSSPEAEESKPMTPEERDHWQRWLNGEFDPDRDKPLKVIDCHDLLDEDDEEEAIENESHPLDKSRKTPPHSPPSHAAAARSQPTAQYELAPNSPVSANPTSLQDGLGQIPLEIPSIASEAILEAEEKKGRSRKADEPSSEQLSEEFERFWKLYPRKLNKSKAKAKFILHRKKGVPFQDMMQMLEICVAKEWEGRDMEYIPHPTTWINGERWIELEDIAIEIEREKAAAKAIADQEIRDRSAKLALACYREKPYRNLHFYFPLKHHVDLWTDTETKRKVFGTTRRLARPVLADWWNNLKAIGLDAIADMKILPVNEGRRLEIFGEPWKNETRTLAFSDYEGEETYFELVKKYHPFVLEQMAQERSHIDPKALTPEESAALLDEVLERSRQAALTHTVRSGWGKRIEPILEE